MANDGRSEWLEVLSIVLRKLPLNLLEEPAATDIVQTDLSHTFPIVEGKCRKFSGAGFTLGGRCGSLAAGASLHRRLGGCGGWLLRLAHRADRAPTSTPRGKFPVVTS